MIRGVGILGPVSHDTLGSFLLPDGFARPPAAALLREWQVVGETGRHVARRVGDQLPCRGPRRDLSRIEPVVLVPGFMAGDASLLLLARYLREQGWPTHRAHMAANVSCTASASAQLEARVEKVVARHGRRARIAGHSLGGMLARGLAVRRPDLVSGLVTLGSPMLAPGAHHVALTATLGVLVRLSRLGVPGLMAGECVGGDCARRGFAETQQPLPAGVAFTAVYSRRDGVVDWRACIDPEAHAVEVRSSHLGMVVDPHVLEVIARGLSAPANGSVEVESGVGA